MAIEIGTIVGAPLVTGDTNNTFPTHLNNLGKGGWKVVDTVAERDAITEDRREVGMEVKVIEENKHYELRESLTNNDWVEVVYASDGFQKNKYYTISLADLGVATFTEVTAQMISNWRNLLGIVEEDNVNYYFEVTDEPVVEKDITLRGDWVLAEITDEASFLLKVIGINEVVNFEIIGDLISFDVVSIEPSIRFKNTRVTEVIRLNIPTVFGVNFRDNFITYFNPSGNMNLVDNLILSNNLLNNLAFTEMEEFANNLTFGLGNFYFELNTDSVTGTNLEAILISKGRTVIA